MSNEWLDKHLEDRFEQMPNDLNLEAAWGKLDAARNNKRRRIGWIWLLGFTIVVGASGLTYWWLDAPGVDESVEVDTFVETTSSSLDRSDEAVKAEPESSDIGLVAPAISINDQVSGVSGNNSEASITSPNQEPRWKSDAELFNSPAAASVDPFVESDASSEPLVLVESLPERAFIPVGFLNLDTPKYLNLPLPTLHHSAEATPKKKQTKQHTLCVHSMYSWSIGPEDRSVASDYIDMEWEAVDRWSLGLTYQKSLGNRFFAGLGLEYQQWANHTFASQEVIELEPQNNVLLEILLRQDGSIEEVYGEGMAEVQKESTYRVWEQHSSFTVPVYAGLWLIQNEKLSLSLSAGWAPEFILQRKGKRFNLDSSTPDLVDLDQLIWTDQLLHQLRANMDVHYRLGSSSELILGLHFQNDLQNHLEAERYPEQEYYRLLGLRLAYGYSF